MLGESMCAHTEKENREPRHHTSPCCARRLQSVLILTRLLSRLSPACNRLSAPSPNGLRFFPVCCAAFLQCVIAASDSPRRLTSVLTRPLGRLTQTCHRSSGSPRRLQTASLLPVCRAAFLRRAN